MLTKVPPNPEILAQLTSRLHTEMCAGETIGKIDWAKVLELLIELLPLILAFFADEAKNAK